LSLLDGCAPALAAELRNLVREIVFVRSESGDGRLVFHGASTFYLWGAIFLNAERHSNRVVMAEGLAHESAHSLLFGFTFGAPLVENPPEERFPSPLRYDPRPMDGIAHATFVLARMEYCMQQLLRSNRLTDEERSLALAASRRNQANYREGADVIAAHARFTPIGAALLEGAAAYMQECSGLAPVA
jgi:HEXXH motif-containing protein